MSEEKIMFEKIEMKERCNIIETNLKNEIKRKEM